MVKGKVQGRCSGRKGSRIERVREEKVLVDARLKVKRWWEKIFRGERGLGGRRVLYGRGGDRETGFVWGCGRREWLCMGSVVVVVL